MKRHILFSLFIFFSFQCIYAQNKQWSLEECIRYALEHNISVKQLQIDRSNNELNLNTAKSSRLPDLSSQVTQSWGFGLSKNNAEQIYKNQTASGTGFYLSSSIPLFTGFKIPNQIKKAELDLAAATANLEKAKDDLSVTIANYYLQVLVNKEILKVDESQLALSEEQVERTKVLVEAGKSPASQLLDIKAQAAKDKVSLVVANNNLKLSLLDLAQGLELERDSSFDIQNPVMEESVLNSVASLVSPDVLYDRAVKVKPVVKQQELLLESSKRNLDIAKAAYWPTLDLSLSLGTNYNYAYNLSAGLSNESFWDQIKHNRGENIGLTLAIPIFSRNAVRNQVRSARLAIDRQALETENTKKSLYKEIQTAYYNAVGSLEKYHSSQSAVKSAREAFEAAKEKYGVGKSSVYEFNDAKNKLIQSESDLIQAKYDYIFRTKILDFYNGISIKL